MRRADFHAAWSINDAVLAARNPATRNDPSRPYHERWVWDGTPVDGRHVLVRCYHGLGDTLQFCRYLPALARRAASVSLEVQPPLAPLLGQLPALRLHPFDPANPLPPAELDLEIMELAHALRLPPDPAPYLRATPLPGERGTGFCWRAGGWDPARDIPPGLLRPLVDHLRDTGDRAVSLQRGPAARGPAACAPVACELEVVDPLDRSMDLARLARLVAGLDRVVTVDTMVAHLAAALGVPTFVLLRHHADWRWGNGAHTPWYRSARPIRQPAPGAWREAVDQLLGTLVQERGCR